MEQDYHYQTQLMELEYREDLLVEQETDTKFFTDDGIDLDELLNIDYKKLTHEIIKERIRSFTSD